MVSRLPYRRPIFAVVVVLALGGIYVAAGNGHPSAASRPAQASQARAGQAAVSTAVRVCPAPGSGPVTGASVALAAVPATASAGTATVTRLVPGGGPATGATVATVTRPGVLQVSSVRAAPQLTKAQQKGSPGSSPGITTQAGRGGVIVTASGAMAQGLAVEQTSPGGLVSAQCGAPGTSFWFAGPGQNLAGTIELYLMNTGSQAADAQVSAMADVIKGAALQGNADNGITVPPHSMVVQSIGGMLESSKVVALSVSTSVGQVVAAVRESTSASDDGIWLPQLSAPARRQVIAGLPTAAGSRSLYIAVPGSAAASVKITAVTARGSYQPTGGTGISLLGGSAATVPLSSLDGVPGAIVISSSVPVVAAMLVGGGPAGAAGAVAASTGPITEQGVLADNPPRSAGLTDLVLSAPGKAASVKITTATATTPASGQAGQVVQIKAGTSVLVPVRPPAGSKDAEFTIVVTPLSGSGPVYGGRVITEGGTVQSILPVPSSLTRVTLPAVQESLSAFVP